MTESEIRAIVRDELAKQGMEVGSLPEVQGLAGVSVPVVKDGEMMTVPIASFERMEIVEQKIFAEGLYTPSFECYNILVGSNGEAYNVDKADIYLPEVSAGDTAVLKGVIVRLTTGDSPNVSWKITGGGTAPITYMDGFALTANTTYEVSAIWDGRQWTLANTVVVTPDA